MTHQEEMSDNLAKIESVLSLMQQEREFAGKERQFQKEQSEIYRETVDKSLEFQDKEIALMKERQEEDMCKTNSLRLTIRWGVGIAIVLMLSGIGSIATKPSKAYIDKVITNGDFVSKDEGVKGAHIVIEDTYEVFEREGVLTHEEAYVEKNKTKVEASKAITGYRARNVEKNKD